MVDYMRAMLTELFKPFEGTTKSFTDDDVCKDFLVSFCPHELFHNTKADLGPCTKLHDFSLQRKYQETQEKTQYDYENRFYAHLQRLCDDLDRRIKSGKARLAMTPLAQPEQDIRDERRVMLEHQIKELLVKVEEAGEEGRVEEAADLMRSVENIKNELRILVNNEDINPTMRQEKQLEVCEICGAFIATNDTTERHAAHLSGKQHTGYLRIREAIAAFKVLFITNGQVKGGRVREQPVRAAEPPSAPREERRGSTHRPNRSRGSRRDERPRSRSPHEKTRTEKEHKEDPKPTRNDDNYVVC